MVAFFFLVHIEISESDFPSQEPTYTSFVKTGDGNSGSCLSLETFFFLLYTDDKGPTKAVLRGGWAPPACFPLEEEDGSCALTSEHENQNCHTFCVLLFSMYYCIWSHSATCNPASTELLREQMTAYRSTYVYN